MSAILVGVRVSVKEKLCKHLRRCRDANVRVRYLILINLLNHRSAYQTADVLGVHNTTVYRVVRRFRERGECALGDAREDNGETKLDEHSLEVLHRVVRGTLQQYGWRRPTWTRELLVETLVRQTGVRIHVATMSRALALLQARRGLPLGKSHENQAVERDSAPVGEFAARPEGVLRGRSGYPPQPEDRFGLDGARSAKGSRDTGEEREALLGRGVGCAERATGVGRGRAEDQCAV